MRPVAVTVGPLAAANASNICTSQTTAGAAALTLNGTLVSGGVATLDKPRRILVTNAGNDSGISIIFTGTNGQAQLITETVAGTSGSTAYTVQDFATVTKAVTTGATSASGVTIGTNAIASSWPVFLDHHALAPTSLQVVVTGTVNYTVQQTLDNPRTVGFASLNWFASSDSAVVAATASAQSNYAYLPFAARILLNSGTGSATFTVLQAAAPK
jgi:hypothetical protein